MNKIILNYTKIGNTAQVVETKSIEKNSINTIITVRYKVGVKQKIHLHKITLYNILFMCVYFKNSNNYKIKSIYYVYVGGPKKDRLLEGE